MNLTLTDHARFTDYPDRATYLEELRHRLAHPEHSREPGALLGADDLLRYQIEYVLGLAEEKPPYEGGLNTADTELFNAHLDLDDDTRHHISELGEAGRRMYMALSLLVAETRFHRKSQAYYEVFKAAGSGGFYEGNFAVKHIGEEEYRLTWRDWVIGWYKHPARSVRVNRVLSMAECWQFYNECRTTLLAVLEGYPEDTPITPEILESVTQKFMRNGVSGSGKIQNHGLYGSIKVQNASFAGQQLHHPADNKELNFYQTPMGQYAMQGLARRYAAKLDGLPPEIRGVTLKDSRVSLNRRLVVADRSRGHTVDEVFALMMNELTDKAAPIFPKKQLGNDSITQLLTHPRPFRYLDI